MIQINNDNSASIKLSKSFYSKNNILSCLDIYRDFLSGKIEESEKNFILTIVSKDKDYSCEELAAEFANYLIALEKENKKNKDGL